MINRYSMCVLLAVMVSMAGVGETNEKSTNNNKTSLPVTTRLSPYLASIAYGDGVFIAVGRIKVYHEPRDPWDGYLKGGVILRSSDGVNWDEQIREDLEPKKVYFLNDRFFLLDGETSVVMKSKDGLIWEADKNISLPWNDVTRGDELFVGVSGRPGSLFGRTRDLGGGISKDLKEWTSIPVPKPFQSITYGRGKFVALGNIRTGSTLEPRIYLNDRYNGPWEEVFSGPLRIRQLYALAYGDGVFVAVGDNYVKGGGGTAEAFVSSDGRHWRQINTGIRGPLHDVTYGESKFVAVCSGSCIANGSQDGTTWKMVRSWGPLKTEGVDLEFFER